MPRGARVIAAGAVVAGVLLVSGVWAVLGDSERSSGERVPDAGLVHFAAGHGYEPVRTVLRSPTDVAVFAERFPAAALGSRAVAGLAGRDFGAEVLVAFAWSTGCASADSADLRSSGEQGLFAVPVDATPYRKCAEPWDALAVFAVPRERAPHDVELQGAAPDPPGPAAAAARS
jgi:hypothetical protein